VLIAGLRAELESLALQLRMKGGKQGGTQGGKRKTAKAVNRAKARAIAPPSVTSEDDDSGDKGETSDEGSPDDGEASLDGDECSTCGRWVPAANMVTHQLHHMRTPHSMPPTSPAAAASFTAAVPAASCTARREETEAGAEGMGSGAGEENEEESGEETEEEGEEGHQAAEEEGPGKFKCVVCYELDRSVVFLPCAHLCCCLNCSLHLFRCPVCRTESEGAVRVYM
jgi:hypothetical protein